MINSFHLSYEHKLSKKSSFNFFIPSVSTPAVITSHYSAKVADSIFYQQDNLYASAAFKTIRKRLFQKLG